jgi:tetratricopeptide (TPR) repeat protein
MTVLIPAAEESYRRGLRALSDGHRKEAMALFEAAIEIERRRSCARPQARYLSYYGLCLAVELNELHEALRYCREAATLESFNPDIRCNLGRVLLRAGRRREAHRCFMRGLRLESDHAPTLRALSIMGIRRRPILPFLARENPINVFLGRLRKAG